MEMRERPDIPEEKIIEVKNNVKKIDFRKPYKFIYFEKWFAIVTFPLLTLTLIMVFFSSFYFGLRVKGKKQVNRVLRKRGCITVSNHCHYFDTVFANYILLPKRLYVSVVQRNYEVPVVRFVLRILKAFPIPANPVGFKMITKPVGEAHYPPALEEGHAFPKKELREMAEKVACWMEDTIAEYHKS